MADSMYGKGLAKYYDLIYSGKDYEKEAGYLKDMILKNEKSNGMSLLEVACGTGRHLEYLENDFKCIGLDLDKEMLKIARKRLRKTRLIQGDMIDLHLNQKFDIIICMFSSIGYLKTYGKLEKALNNFSRHLNKGGVVIIQPWLTKRAYKIGRPSMQVYDSEDIKIARLNVSMAKGNISILEMHHLIAERGKPVKNIVSREELGMFETPVFLNMMERAGFNAKFIDKKPWELRGILIGIKR